jgi:HEAT repeat protein
VKTFDPKADTQPDHPIWARFKAIAGDTRASRELFARIIREEYRRRLLDDAEANRAAAPRIYRDAVVQMHKDLHDNFSLYLHLPVWPCDLGEEAAFFLFLGSHPDLESARPTTQLEANQFEDGEIIIYRGAGLNNGLQGKLLDRLAKKDSAPQPGAEGTDRVFGRLLAAWLKSHRHDGVLRAGFDAAVMYGVGDVLPVAREVARDKTRTVEARCDALLAVAQFGSPADLPLFTPLFDDKTLRAVREPKAPPGTKPPEFTTEARDEAMALALLLCNRDPAEFGFARAEKHFRRVNDRPVLAEYGSVNFGFPDDKARATAHTKAKAFLDEQKTEPKPDPAVALVEQLGSTSFREREAAHKALLALGLKAEYALRAGLKSEDPELRSRCAEVLAEIRKDALDDLVKRFDPRAAEQPDHPIWARFKTITGDTRAGRDLFKRLLKNEGWLRRLDAAETGSEVAKRQYRDAVMEIGRTVRRNLTAGFHVYVWPGDPADQVAYLLFLGSAAGTEPACPADKDEAETFRFGESQIYGARGLRMGLAGEEIAPGPKEHYDETAALTPGSDRAFARLLVAWLVRHTGSDSLYAAFWLAARFGVTELLPLARKVAADKLPYDAEIGSKVKVAALAAVAALGTKADLPLFVPLFSDKTVVARLVFSHGKPDLTALFGPPGPFKEKPPAPPPEVITAQARDCAYALALLLHGEHPAWCGFTRAALRGKPDQPPRVGIYDETSFGFLDGDDKLREAAHAEATAFLDMQKEPKKDEQKPDPAALVKQLGSANFAEREAAQKQLKELGSKARPALEAGAKSDDPEIVRRCRELLDQLARAEFEAKHWARFAKVIGDDKASRALFERIRSLRRNVELLDAVAADPQAAGKLYHDRWTELNKAARIPLGPGQHQLSAAALADIVGWMYLGTFPGAEGGYHTSYSLDFLPFLPVGKNSTDGISTALKDDTVAAPIRKLVGAWTAARTDYSGRAFGFQLAIQFDIKEVLPAARETLTAKVKDDPYPGNTARNVGYAMIVIGKLGSKDDLPLLEKYATNGERCSVCLIDPPPKPGEPVFRLYRFPKDGQDATGQLRDVSAAMRLHLLGENPDDFGFYWRYPDDTLRKPLTPEQRFGLYSIGFIRDTDRTAAHKKAKERFDKQKK